MTDLFELAGGKNWLSYCLGAKDFQVQTKVFLSSSFTMTRYSCCYWTPNNLRRRLKLEHHECSYEDRVWVVSQAEYLTWDWFFNYRSTIKSKLLLDSEVCQSEVVSAIRFVTGMEV